MTAPPRLSFPSSQVAGRANRAIVNRGWLTSAGAARTSWWTTRLTKTLNSVAELCPPPPHFPPPPTHTYLSAWGLIVRDTKVGSGYGLLATAAITSLCLLELKSAQCRKKKRQQKPITCCNCFDLWFLSELWRWHVADWKETFPSGCCKNLHAM